MPLCLLLAACAVGTAAPDDPAEGQPGDAGPTQSQGGTGPGEPPDPCGSDVDCKGDRICEDGACVSSKDSTQGTMSDAGGEGRPGAGASDAATVPDAGRTDAGTTGGAGGGGGAGGSAGAGMTPLTNDELCTAACATQAAVGCPGFDRPGCEATCRDSFTTCAACNNELIALHTCSAGVPVTTYVCEGPQPTLLPTGCLAEVTTLVNCRFAACPGT